MDASVEHSYQRSALIAVATAAVGGLMLAAVHIARQGAGSAAMARTAVFAFAMLTVPVLVLAVQAGAFARDRRRATLTGGVLAGAVYLVVWLGLGVLPPERLRLIDAPDRLDIVVAAVIAVLAGAVVLRPARLRPGRLSLWLLFAGLALVLAVLVYIRLAFDDTDIFPAVIALAVAGYVALFAGGPRFARRLRTRGGLERRLASDRLDAATGRVLAVLFVCGFVLGFEAYAYQVVTRVFIVTRGSAGTTIRTPPFWTHGSFMVVLGMLMTLVAVAVAMLTLVVSAADARTLAPMARHQLACGTVIAVVAGVLSELVAIVAVTITMPHSGLREAAGELAYASGAAAIALAGFVWVAGRLGARLLRPRLR